MGNLLVPVETFDIVSSRGGISQAERALEIVEIRNKKLP